MSMTKPIAQPVIAFDATTNHTFYFTSSGGNQVVYNRIIIRNNSTNAIVYNNLVESFKFEHIVPSGILTNGTYYNYTITTYDVNSVASEPSIAVAFYCYTAPTITFTNIPVGNIVTSSSFSFDVTYDQVQDELLDTLTINLYDVNGSLISTSGNMYNSGNPPLTFSHLFSGFSDNTIYKISSRAVSINGTITDTGLIQFITSYYSPTMFSILELTNSCDGGYVEIKNNMIIIEGSSNPSPPTYVKTDLTESTLVPTYTFNNTYVTYPENDHSNTTVNNIDTNLSTLFNVDSPYYEPLHSPVGSVCGYFYSYYGDFSFPYNGSCMLQVLFKTDTNILSYGISANLGNFNINENAICSNGVYTTNIPIFNTYEDCVSFMNGTKDIEEAVNYDYLKDYIDFGSVNVDLKSNGTYVRWVEGYDIVNGFTMGLWGRSYNINVPIYTLANANGSIVVKFVDDYPYGETILQTCAELTVYDGLGNKQYTMYSNFIPTTSLSGNIFIWTRRINNIYELQVEVM